MSDASDSGIGLCDRPNDPVKVSAKADVEPEEMERPGAFNYHHFEYTEPCIQPGVEHGAQGRIHRHNTSINPCGDSDDDVMPRSHQITITDNDEADVMVPLLSGNSKSKFQQTCHDIETRHDVADRDVEMVHITNVRII